MEIHSERAPLNPALVRLNRINENFYRKQMRAMTRRMKNEILVDLAFRQITKEAVTGMDMKRRASLESALAHPEEIHLIFLSASGRKARGVSKADALTRWIVDMVRSHPDISVGKLLQKLRKIASLGGEFIRHVDDTSALLPDQIPQIHFQDGGRLRKVRISGLKDRLSRAKNKIKHKAAQANTVA